MMSVLFSPDQNNQSFRLLRMVSASYPALLLEVTYTTEALLAPSHPGPGASGASSRRAANPSWAVPMTQILYGAPHSLVHSMTRNYSGTVDETRSEHKTNRPNFHKEPAG